MVLHHTDDPARNSSKYGPLAQAGGTYLSWQSFTPTGRASKVRRVTSDWMPARLRTWCEAAGFSLLYEKRQSPEHYMLVVQQRA